MKIGTDITVVSRIGKSIDRFGDKFLDRFLNQDEKRIAKRVETIAGFWAGKEAVSKALGCGIGRELSFHDIIIYKDDKNAPHFKLKPKAQDIHKIIDSSLSIAHDGGFAIAVVVLEKG
jgi:holo-[acyl-carrier protein] synthase